MFFLKKNGDNKRSHGKRKKLESKTQNRHSLTFSDFSIILKQAGRHIALSRLVTLSISSILNFVIEAINSMIELIDFMMQQFLLGVKQIRTVQYQHFWFSYCI